MPFCTIVEFEFGAGFTRAQFEAAIGGGVMPMPAGQLSRITGIDDSAARIVEVWQSPADAQRFAEQSAPQLQASQMPAPAHVVGFNVTSYETS